MSTATEPLTRSSPTHRVNLTDMREQLRVSKFDSVSSLLLATLLVVGLFVAMLFWIWLNNRTALPIRTVQPLIETTAYRGDQAIGLKHDFESRPTNTAYEFVIVDQRYRHPLAGLRPVFPASAGTARPTGCKKPLPD